MKFFEGLTYDIAVKEGVYGICFWQVDPHKIKKNAPKQKERRKSSYKIAILLITFSHYPIIVHICRGKKREIIELINICSKPKSSFNPIEVTLLVNRSSTQSSIFSSNKKPLI